MAVQTPKLHLLLIQEDWKFADDSFNLVISDMDNKLLGISHAESNVHWAGWKSGYSYSKGDVIRIENGKSNQYYYCVTNGISGTTEPTNDITGSLVTDGAVTWKVCEIMDSEASASVDIFRGGLAYNKGQLVLYNEVLYRCKVSHVAASTMELDTDKWQQVDASLQPWKASVYFLVDDIVVYDGVIYKCITAHTSGYSFDYTKWQPLTITLINDWEVNTKYLQNQIVLYEGILYRATDAHTSDATDFGNDVGTHWEYVCAELPEWGASISYVAGQVVLHNNRLYKCNTAHTSTSTFDNTKWDSILALSIIEDWQIDTVYTAGQLVLNEGNLYKANQNHTSDSTSILADMAKWDLVYASVGTWTDNVNYKVGQLVIYNNKLYKCNANHLSTTTFDPTKFDAIVSFPVIEEWQTSTSYLANQVVKYKDMLLLAIDAHTSDGTDIINDMDVPNNNNHWKLLYANIAPWQATTVYKEGCQVIYANNLYQCTATHTSGATFAIANWVLIGQANAFIPNWEANKYYYANQVVVIDKELYRCDTTHTSSSDWATDKTNWTKISSATIIEPWASNTEYLVNQVVTINGILYRCTTAHTSTSTFDTTKWTPVYANIVTWAGSTDYRVGELVLYNNQIYKCTTAHNSGSSGFEPTAGNWATIANNIAGIPMWASGVHYYANQVVKYNGKIWRCLTGHKSGAEDTPEMVKYYENNSYGFFSVHSLDALPKDYTVDLGSSVNINRVRVASGGAYLSIAGNLQVSSDGTNYKNIYDFYLGSGFDENVYNSGRYVRLHVTNSYLPIGMHPDGSEHVTLSLLAIYGDSNKWECIVDPSIKITYWAQNTNYKANEIVLYQDEIYRCLETHNSGTSFDSTKWKKIPDLVISNWASNTTYKVNQVVFYDGKLYKCITAHTSSSTFTQANWTPINDTIDDWATSKNYYVKQVVKYNNSLWRCKTQHLSATEKPEDNEIYTASGNTIDVNDTTTIPYNEVIDLGASYKIQKLQYTEVATDMSMKYYIETSTDGITYTDYEDNGTARYIRITVYEVDIDTGAVSPQAYLDSFKVYAYSDKWEEVSTMNTLTDEEIDAMFI